MKSRLEKEEEDPTSDTERDIGMRIARICYFLYSNGKPFADYEKLLLLHHLNHVMIGNINHSRHFPRQFLPFVADVIKKRKVKFLSSRMVQTGFRPALAITADLATFQLKCRHFTAAIVCVPDAEDLLQVCYLDQPVIGPRAGRDLAKQIDEVLANHEVDADQIKSTFTDGAYHHDSVPKYLEELWDVDPGDVHHAWDAMHKSALEDGHLLKLDKFKWVEDVTTTVCEGFKMFRVGKKYFMLNEICDRLNLKLAHPTTLSETRMANYKFVVLNNFVKDLKPIIIALETIQQEKCAGNSKERAEADVAAAYRSKIFTRKFILKVTGMSDIYNVYGNITNILQKVNVLPHEKYDMFVKLIDKLKMMVKTVDISFCSVCSPVLCHGVF